MSEEVTAPEVKVSKMKKYDVDYVEITLGQTINTGDYGSIKPEVKMGFKIPADVDPDKFIRKGAYKFSRWLFMWLTMSMAKDHVGLRENLDSFLRSFFQKYPDAPPLKYKVRSAEKILTEGNNDSGE